MTKISNGEGAKVVVNRERFEAKLAELKLKQTQLATDLGVSNNAVSNWKKGEPIGLTNAMKLAKRLRTTVEWLTAKAPATEDGRADAVNEDVHDSYVVSEDSSSLWLIHLSGEELDIINTYRKASDLNKEMVRHIITSIKMRTKEEGGDPIPIR
jgi:transcriptional regulator with XRE-family HTH domain